MNNELTIDERTRSSFVFFTGIIAALAGLLFGMDTGVISGALPLIKNSFVLTTSQEGMIVSVLLIGAVIGTLISSAFSRLLGRKTSILISAILFTVGSIFSAVAMSITFLIVVRFFLGIALGIASFTTPLYLAEISPREKRGAMIAMYQLMITIGLLGAFVSDTIFAPLHSWRLMLGVVAIPAFAMLILIVRLPKSPRWLMLKNKRDLAKNILAKILPSAMVEPELNDIQNALTHKRLGLAAFKNKKFLSVVFLGLAAQMLQQWTGINTVMYYAPTIFKSAGFASLTAQMWCTVAVGVVNVLTTLLAIKLIDTLGRRPILFFGLTVMALSLLVAGTSMHIGGATGTMRFISVIAVLAFIFGFAISLGPVVWILCSEIFPLRSRDVGIMITTSGNWLFNAILAQAFPSLVAKFNSYGVFWFFAGLSVIGILFVSKFVPETKGVSLEEIENNLEKGKVMRQLGEPV